MQTEDKGTVHVAPRQRMRRVSIHELEELGISVTEDDEAPDAYWVPEPPRRAKRPRWRPFGILVIAGFLILSILGLLIEPKKPIPAPDANTNLSSQEIANYWASVSTPAPASNAPVPILPTVAPSSPLEYQLAVINAGGFVRQDDITVTRFRYLLSALHDATGNTPQQIADVTVTGQKIIHDRYGKDIKLLDLMEMANSTLVQSGAKLPYDQLMAATVTVYGRQ